MNMEFDSCDSDVVEKLVEAGWDGISSYCRKNENVSTAEVLSACFTMALRSVIWIQKATKDPDKLKHNRQEIRNIILRMLAETADTEKVM